LEIKFVRLPEILIQSARPDHSEPNHAEPNQDLLRLIAWWDLHSSEWKLLTDVLAQGSKIKKR